MTYKKPKPILRATPHGDLYSTINDAIRKYIMNTNDHPFQSCLNCMNWNHGKEFCTKFNARPPADIIVYSCDNYEDNNDIPF